MNRVRLFLIQHQQLLLPVIFLTGLFIYTAAFTLREDVAKDPDIWWHLRTGQWIIEHQALPTTDPFSAVGQGKPWVAYSWLFEILLYGLFQKFGLLGMFGYTTVLTLLLAALLFLHLQQFASGDKLSPLLYATLAVVFLKPFYMPRPWLFTLLFFILELTLLEVARRRGKPQLLWWLIPMFAVWANLHIQFIYGLFLLGFATVEPFIEGALRGELTRENCWGKIKTCLTPSQLFLLLACFAATLATPYHVHLYRPVFEIMQQAGVFNHVTELQPLNFKDRLAWTMLFLFLWVLWRIKLRQLERRAWLLLLLMGLGLALHSQRDLWFLVIVACSLLTMLTRPASPTSYANPAWVTPLALLLSLCALPWLTRQYNLSDENLQAILATRYPVAATKFIEEHDYRGPLFNHFNWGGYLIWRLPQLPVSMDGRTNIYGPTRIARHFSIWGGQRGWASAPELQTAGLVLADVEEPLCELLRLDQRFELVYEDSLAAVFIPRAPKIAESISRNRLLAESNSTPRHP